MTELPIQISRLPVQPPLPSASGAAKPANPTASSTGGVGFKLSLLAPHKPSHRCCLVFRNFYVAWLRIVQINSDGSSTELTSTYPLMQHLHSEDDAQNQQIVRLDQLPVSWNPHALDSLCVYLSQPSLLWETWELRDVKLCELSQETEAKAEAASASTRLGSVSPPRLEKTTSLGRNGSGTDDRLIQLLERRSSRSAMIQSSTGMDSATNQVEEQAARCLDLVLRLRELLHR